LHLPHPTITPKLYPTPSLPDFQGLINPSQAQNVQKSLLGAIRNFTNFRLLECKAGLQVCNYDRSGRKARKRTCTQNNNEDCCNCRIKATEIIQLRLNSMVAVKEVGQEEMNDYEAMSWKESR
jgi:hypothetical protein